MWQKKMDLLIQMFYGQICSSNYNQGQLPDTSCGAKESVYSMEAGWELQMDISMSSCILTKECHSGTCFLSRTTERKRCGGLLARMLSITGKLQPRLLKPNHLCLSQRFALKSLGNPCSKAQNSRRHIEDTVHNGQIKVFLRPWQWCFWKSSRTEKTQHLDSCKVNGFLEDPKCYCCQGWASLTHSSNNQRSKVGLLSKLFLSREERL